jgi:hypothetical protein
MIYYLFDNILFSVTTKMSRQDQDPAGSVMNWPHGFGSVIQNYRSTDPDPKINFYGSTTLIRNHAF